ncbi:gamma carbonic anhydrase family protein [Prescottella equi]|uniref:gamma carbonic anhydrase family protein n=1 Tax=Rhodococcus hoagii TaxID=43767 RepID=UPI001C73FEF9|nr:gamma carbonic anhydrase family protein [Prescottella equi]BCN56016.1 gamma carbonic anhydrase family protein [Prescottella equi]BCN80734.1 gamma carbonic anhydrase family protein [Prescottella equi]
MAIYRLGDLVPDIHPTAFVHPDAVVVGAVTIGADASIWPSAVLRADYGVISVGARTSVQDGTVLHTSAQWPTVIGAGCVVGHNAHLEGAVVEDGCLIGSMSTCLQRVVVGTGSLVGAAALLTEGTVVPPRSRVLGAPATVAPHPDPDGFAEGIERGVATYVANAARYLSEMERIG